jgi:hypothetical protein
MILFPLSPAFGGIIRVPIGIEYSAKCIALKDTSVENMFTPCAMRYAMLPPPQTSCALHIEHF